MLGRGQKWYIMIHFMVIKPRHALFSKGRRGVVLFASSGADTIPHPLPQLAGTRRGGEMEQAEILHCNRAQRPGRN